MANVLVNYNRSSSMAFPLLKMETIHERIGYFKLNFIRNPVFGEEMVKSHTVLPIRASYVSGLIVMMS